MCHAVHGGLETDSLCWSSLNTSVAEIKRVTLYNKNKSDERKFDNLRNSFCQMSVVGKFQYRYMTIKKVNCESTVPRKEEVGRERDKVNTIYVSAH